MFPECREGARRLRVPVAGRGGGTGMQRWLEAGEAGSEEAGQEPFITCRFAPPVEQVVFSFEGKYISVGSSANLVSKARSGVSVACAEWLS